MKNAIIALIGIAMVIMVTVGINTVENKTMRQNELDNNLDKALERTMEILTIDPTYRIGKNETEVAADFIENYLVNTTGDATFQIDIKAIDPEKGLLDVEVTGKYSQIIGSGKVSSRKTVILDDWENNENVYFTVQFEKDNKVIKEVNVHGGDKITKSILPQSMVQEKDTVFKGWRMIKPQESDVLYTEDTITNLSVTDHLVFQAIYQKK